jgi:hypothetical protein
MSMETEEDVALAERPTEGDLRTAAGLPGPQAQGEGVSGRSSNYGARLLYC